MKAINVSLDVFAAIWANRREHEQSENDVLMRLLGLDKDTNRVRNQDQNRNNIDKPETTAWKDILLWSFDQLGGEASLDEIYEKSREARLRLGMGITPSHNASARECLESHSSESAKFRGKADLFHMPKGKGKGYWGLKEDHVLRKRQADAAPWLGDGVILKHGVKLRMKYKGRHFFGEINNGYWQVEGQRFRSPSDAASGVSIITNGTRSSLNGWTYWEVQLPNEKTWIALSSLRKKV